MTCPLAGQLVRLRVTEVDNQFYFQVGVDNVTLSGGSGATSVRLSTAGK